MYFRYGLYNYGYQEIADWLCNESKVKMVIYSILLIFYIGYFVNEERGMNEKDVVNRVMNLNDVTAQDLLCTADMLITDYSSCFFDYLILDRPIIHYIYDYDFYKNEDRGLYYSKEEVIAGSEVFDEKELADAIIENFYNPEKYALRRAEIREKFVNYENENSCEQIYKQLWMGCKRRS